MFTFISRKCKQSRFLQYFVEIVLLRRKKRKPPNLLVGISDEQVECIKHADSYIPPLWIMCLESVSHLLVMLNFSSNFLIYCSASNQFKSALTKLCSIFSFCHTEASGVAEASEYYSLHTTATNLGIALVLTNIIKTNGIKNYFLKPMKI